MLNLGGINYMVRAMLSWAPHMVLNAGLDET